MNKLAKQLIERVMNGKDARRVVAEAASDNVLMHLSDWSGEDKAYTLPRAALATYRSKIKSAGASASKDDINKLNNWLLDQGKRHDSARGIANKAGFFLDWNNAHESASEWEDDELKPVAPVKPAKKMPFKKD